MCEGEIRRKSEQQMLSCVAPVGCNLRHRCHTTGLVALECKPDHCVQPVSLVIEDGVNEHGASCGVDELILFQIFDFRSKFVVRSLQKGLKWAKRVGGVKFALSFLSNTCVRMQA